MTVQITIVGLGQIGTSVGLALADHRDLTLRVGHDREIGIARQAEKMGALDKVMVNLPSAVRDADLILLALPLDQIYETLKVITLDLREGAVVMDTAPAKGVVAAWCAEILPAERYYVGLTPAINPKYLYEVDCGIHAAHPDLFQNSLMGIISPPGVPSDAIRLAADLTRLLGATPLFADLLEIDGLMAAAQTIPQLLSAALLEATVEQPGWRETRKVTGRAYAQITAPLTHPTSPRALQSAALHNRANVMRVMDGVIASLQAMREDIQNEDGAALDERLARLRKSRETWWGQRLAGDWTGEEHPPVEAPTASEVFGRLLGLGRKRKP